MKDSRDSQEAGSRLEEIANEKPSLWMKARTFVNRYRILLSGMNLESKGDMLSKKGKPRDACDMYLPAIFLYEAAGSQKAHRVRYKLEQNNACTYYPPDRKAWEKLKKIIYGESWLKVVNKDYDPAEIARTHLRDFPAMKSAFVD